MNLEFIRSVILGSESPYVKIKLMKSDNLVSLKPYTWKMNVKGIEIAGWEISKSYESENDALDGAVNYLVDCFVPSKGETRNELDILTEDETKNLNEINSVPEVPEDF